MESIQASGSRRRFSVDEYYRMGEAGIFGEDDRVELLEGEIFRMTPIGTRHAECVDRLTNILAGRAAGRAIVRVQNPVRLSDESEPQPDLMLLRPRAGGYAARHPGPGDVLLLIEVADESLTFDRGQKLRAYARSGIPEVWIIDLDGRELLRFGDPEAGAYRIAEVRRPGDTLAPQALPELAVVVSDAIP